MDTIFALATAPGRAGLAVIRISGPVALTVAEALCGPLPFAGRSLRKVRDSQGNILDEALILTFTKGASFTGEVVVELHLHGSPAVVAAVSRVIGGFHGVRMAEAGEFTRRAMDNGRLDLAQVEGLADLLSSETEAQRKQAMRLMAGELGDRAARWRKDLIRARALVEATIDFADEEVPVDVSGEVVSLIAPIHQELVDLSAGTKMAERLRHGFEVAIIGEPNAGKSTLLNRLAGREAAITSSYAGTTRDVIEVRMDLAGLPVTLLDTAGVRDTDEPVEQMGIALAVRRAEQADLRVHLVGQDDATVIPVQDGDIVLRAKDDDGAFGGVSGKTGAGVGELIEKISVHLSGLAGNAGLATHERHRIAMTLASDHLMEAVGLIAESVARADELAEELRLAIRAIDALVGRVDVEDILDVVFSSFCIGK